MNLRFALTLIAALAASAAVNAHDYKVGKLHIKHPHARPTAPRQPAAGAYMSIENLGTETDKLVRIESPIAKSAEIHSMSMDGNVMRMREVGEIELKPSEKVEMMPGHGYHLMLIGLQRPLKPGDSFPLTLIFEKAGKTEVSVKVEQNAAKKETHGGAHHAH
jgi:copper(I)-binding protein